MVSSAVVSKKFVIGGKFNVVFSNTIDTLTDVYSFLESLALLEERRERRRRREGREERGQRKKGEIV